MYGCRTPKHHRYIFLAKLIFISTLGKVIINERDMSKNTLYFNTVGRSGKTSTAVIDALKRNAKLYTNDWHNITDELYADLFKKDHFVKIPQPVQKPDGTLDYGLNIDSDDDIVFDFGGYVDERVEFVARYVDKCVVPVHYLGKDEGIQTIRIVQALLKLNTHVSILIKATTGIIKSVSHFVTNNNTNCSVVYSIITIHIEKWRLKNCCRENNFV